MVVVCSAISAITPVLGYLVAIIAGTLVAGLAYAFLKRPEAGRSSESSVIKGVLQGRNFLPCNI